MIIIACAYKLDENDKQEKNEGRERILSCPIYVHHQVFPSATAKVMTIMYLTGRYGVSRGAFEVE